jgi:ABC-type Mn2+/Zn2+ transport system permease subunit
MVLSAAFNLPSGPTIVAMQLTIFLIATVLPYVGAVQRYGSH